MKDVIITVICVAVLGAAGFLATFYVVRQQQVATLQAVKMPNVSERVAYAESMRDVSQQETTDVGVRYKYALVVGAVGVLIGIGLGVLISDMVDAKKPHPAPTPA